MTKHRLQRFRSIATFGGYATTASGIVLSYATGGSLPALGLSVFGLLLTCCGHWISHKIAEHQAKEKAEDEERFSELEDRLDKANTESESASYYYQEQIESMEKRLRDWSLRFDEPYDLD